MHMCCISIHYYTDIYTIHTAYKLLTYTPHIYIHCKNCTAYIYTVHTAYTLYTLTYTQPSWTSGICHSLRPTPLVY